MLHADIRQVADGNPGASNVLRAGGKASAALALLLDFLKGAIPVGLAYGVAGHQGWGLVPIALAPVLGHAFSPFLHGHGGKGVAVTGGIWCGLTLWEGPTIGGIGLAAATFLFGPNGWAVISAIAGMAAYLLLTPATWNGLATRPHKPVLLVIAAGNLLIVAWKHRADLSRPAQIRAIYKPWPRH